MKISNYCNHQEESQADQGLAFKKADRCWLSAGISGDRNNELANNTLVDGGAMVFLSGLDLSW